MNNHFFIALHDHRIPENACFIYITNQVCRVPAKMHQHVFIPIKRKLDVSDYSGPYTFLHDGAQIKIGNQNLSFFTNFFIFTNNAKSIAFFDDFATFTVEQLYLLRRCDGFLYRTAEVRHHLHQHYIFGSGKTHRIIKSECLER